MQKITIDRLQVPTLIGVYDWERESKTELLISIELWADLTTAMQSDAVNDTIDYALVANCVCEIAADTSYQLIESLGNTIGNQLMSQFPIIKLVLCIEKPDILPNANTVAVTFAFDSKDVAAVC